ncbi:MAG: cytochrome c family protein [Melioribacteraceae bacterium]|nr:cytochrome c family protein [Melioribacteraceae bacterium]MCF8356163.1 cytochrome c family protein [Melioribacteraceae bacterium]MCF8392329.1 cytochrome c family protein [Melioribacteraceae bacterium]MCF8417661.1 cytochrome c family protein [Melioribacteraceae bacterium]
MSLTLITILVFLLVGVSTSFAQEYNYVGSKTCGMCHKKDKDGAQLKVWEESMHSKAYEVLKTEEANKIAAEKGFGKAVEAKECLQCHAVGYDLDASRLDKKFKIEDGVQCETCHGPGSEYKSMKVMKSQEESVNKGLKIFKNDDEIKALCVTCHNDKSPTFKGFDFAKMYAKIKHNIPEK